MPLFSGLYLVIQYTNPIDSGSTVSVKLDY